jgi:hypothetical protein
MTTRLFWKCVLSLLIASYPGLVAPAQDCGPEPGFKLLEGVVSVLGRAARNSGTVEEWNAAIFGLAAELKSFRAARKVDDLFAVRYSRLLSAVRQALLKDPQVLYWPMYRSSMIDFVEERTGRVPDWNKLLFTVNDHGGSGVGLAMIVDAVLSEVVSLHIHLENVGRRQGILEDYLAKPTKP